MKPIFCSVFLFVYCMLFIAPAMAQSREEFNGPLPGWADVKKQFGARGNGKDDDTRAFQRAIDDLRNPVTNFNTGKGGYMVLYVPAGTYCISNTLVLRGKIGVSIIGEDPNNTVIKWTGAAQDTMLLANGSAYYRISRLSWDPNGRKDMEGIGIHWIETWNNNKSRSFASVNIELSDNYFKTGFKNAISGGTYQRKDGTGSNDSEVTIKRCTFEGCTDAGINIHGFNALDYWIWDCKFIKCFHGVYCANGNYHAYRSYFSGSTYFDFKNNGVFYSSVRGCFSENSFGFSVDEGSSCNPFKRIFQNNTVLNLVYHPIVFLHTGKITLWNNKIGKVKDLNKTYSVKTGSWCKGIFEIMSMNNNYELKDPLLIENGSLTKFTLGDTYIPKISGSANDFIKSMEPLPAKRARKIFSVPAGASSRTIQELVDQAAALKGQRPVIYFSTGTYALDKTLVIPAGTDMQLVGDGLLYASVITRATNSDFSKQPLILVKGPSQVTIKDLQIGEESDSNPSSAVAFENVDQPASQAHLDQLYSHADTSLITNRLDYLYIEKNNSFFSDGNVLRGGTLTKQGKGTARVSCFGGQFARLSVNDGARFIAKDCWWEGKPRIPLDIKGSGVISIDGSMLAPWAADSTPTIKVGEFNGNISLLNMYIQGSVKVDPGKSALNLLLWNNNFFHKLSPHEYVKSGTAAKIALLGSNSQCVDGREACQTIYSIPDQMYRVNSIPAFINDITAFDRSQKPQLFTNLPAGVSNIYMSRVAIGAARRGVVFSR
ncbi:right-handed parallel beta-helix repeat-containing protein [Longitalea arenae]|uniref:right-handed parallel beta-helix repeat-containing protein n=1 Tax=Longitalea arenae TaxID=2812558 RepID=UPI001966FBF1|nr:right-handed parallel beta-helix repeat-containing protein [Longitalea arenae]